jgi:SAM-dependent methyltransferase
MTLDRADLEVVDCALCGGSEHRGIHEVPPVKIVRCTDCGLVYDRPRLAAGAREQLYSDDYFVEKQEDGTGADYVDRHERDVLSAHERMAEIERFIDPGRMLEIGCATGSFLVAARERGWRVHGLEISPFAARHARERWDLAVDAGVLAPGRYPPERFDLVVMNHVLEHVADPVHELRLVHEIVRPGGLLALEVPDFGSRIARRSGTDWPYLRPYEHLYHFTRETLAEMLRKAGFSVVHHHTLNRPQVMKTVERFKLSALVMANLKRLTFLRRIYRTMRGALGYDDLLVVFGRRA